MFADAAAEDFFRARLDHMIDLRHPLAVLASRMRTAVDRAFRMPADAALAVYVAVVCVAGAVVTWAVVPLPAGSGADRRTRTPWSLALGLFAAVPIAYLVLVVLHEIVKPFLG